MYPEATTTNGQTLIRFKPGAFIPRMPVQPVIVRGAMSTKHFDWSLTNGSKYFWWRFLTQIYHPMSIQWLSVHVPTAAEEVDVVLFAENVRHHISIPAADSLSENPQLCVDP